MDTAGYECEYCGRHFQRSFNLKRHLEMIHNRSYEDDNFDSNASETHDSDEETVPDDHESDAESNADESIVNSSLSDEVMNDDEWASYTKRLDIFMIEVYKDTYDEVMSADEVTDCHNMETDDHDDTENKEYTVIQEVLDSAKKTFRKRLTNMLIICSGLKRDMKYERLFAKIEKYLSKDVDLHSAIAMAVKSSAEIVYDDFTESVNRLLNDDSPTDEESSSTGDEDDSGEGSESEEENDSDEVSP